MAKVFLLTGLSGAGKTTLATAVRESLKAEMPCVLLDGDEMRKGVCRDLGFSAQDREENIRRCGEFAKILANQGITVLMAVIAPYQKLRENLKNIIGPDKLFTIHVDCPLEICIQRDPKKNYLKAHFGKLKNYTGLHDSYEIPEKPDMLVRTSHESEQDSIARVTDFVKEKLGHRRGLFYSCRLRTGYSLGGFHFGLFHHLLSFDSSMASWPAFLPVAFSCKRAASF